MGSLDGHVKQMFNRSIFAEEFISLVLRIISPALKPVLRCPFALTKVNEQLISPSDRLALFRVVDAMIQTNLKYTQYKVDDGSFIFKLEPAGVENLIAFGTETKGIRGRYAVRQLVAREMERERIRRRKGGISCLCGGAD
jgi:chromosome transmission fidelity protein 18